MVPAPSPSPLRRLDGRSASRQFELSGARFASELTDEGSSALELPPPPIAFVVLLCSNRTICRGNSARLDSTQLNSRSATAPHRSAPLCAAPRRAAPSSLNKPLQTCRFCRELFSECKLFSPDSPLLFSRLSSPFLSIDWNCPGL